VNALEIVRAVQEHGATLALEGGRLLVKGSGERLPSDLRVELARHKTEVLVALGCPMDKALVNILEELRPNLSPALRALPDEKLLALVNWHIIAAWEKTISRLHQR